MLPKGRALSEALAALACEARAALPHEARAAARLRGWSRRGLMTRGSRKTCWDDDGTTNRHAFFALFFRRRCVVVTSGGGCAGRTRRPNSLAGCKGAGPLLRGRCAIAECVAAGAVASAAVGTAAGAAAGATVGAVEGPRRQRRRGGARVEGHQGRLKASLKARRECLFCLRRGASTLLGMLRRRRGAPWARGGKDEQTLATRPFYRQPRPPPSPLFCALCPGPHIL